MRQLFFCAKDIRDYLGAVIDTSEFNSVPDFDPKFPPLNDAPEIQKILRDCMSLYDDCDRFLNSPICMETGIDDLRFDFNFGLRLEIPRGNFHVRISDADSEQIFFDRDISDVQLISVEKFLIRWHIEVFRDGVKIFEHKFNVTNQSVLIAFKNRLVLGDAVAAIPSVAEFERRTGCKLTVFLPKPLREFAANLYPELEQVDSVRIENYATFFFAWIIGTLPILPVDSRMVPIERVAEINLSMKLSPPKPTFKPTAPPVTDEPYVCIAVQASAPEKGWLYPHGWDIVVDYLKSLSYRVFCIDKNATETSDKFTICKPKAAEDFTGNLPIMHRANMLYHAEFFIGLSSGLAWIANAVDCPVVMICGFSSVWNEFDTPYKVSNRLTCNGCSNDLRTLDFFYMSRCTYHGGTSREFECQKKISPRQVINAIERLIVDKNLTPPILRTR